MTREPDITGHNFRPSELADLRFHSEDLARRFLSTYRRVTLHYNSTVNLTNYATEALSTRKLLRTTSQRTLPPLALRDAPAGWDPEHWSLFIFFDLNLRALQDVLYYFDHRFPANELDFVGRIKRAGVLEDLKYLPKIYEGREGLRKCLAWLRAIVTKEKTANTKLARMHADSLVNHLELLNAGVMECRMWINQVVFFDDDNAQLDGIVKEILKGVDLWDAKPMPSGQGAAQEKELANARHRMMAELNEETEKEARLDEARREAGYESLLHDKKEQTGASLNEFYSDIKTDECRINVQKPHGVRKEWPSYAEYSQRLRETLADKETAKQLHERSKGLIFGSIIKDDFLKRMPNFNDRKDYVKAMSQFILEQSEKQAARIAAEKEKSPVSCVIKLVDHSVRAGLDEPEPVEPRRTRFSTHTAPNTDNNVTKQPASNEVSPRKEYPQTALSFSPQSVTETTSTLVAELSPTESDDHCSPPPRPPPGFSRFIASPHHSPPPVPAGCDGLPRFKDDPPYPSRPAARSRGCSVSDDFLNLLPDPAPKSAARPVPRPSPHGKEMTNAQKMIVDRLRRIELVESIKKHYKDLWPTQTKKESGGDGKEETNPLAPADMTGWTPEQKAAHKAREKTRIRGERKKEKRKLKKKEAVAMNKTEGNGTLGSIPTNAVNYKRNGKGAGKKQENADRNGVDDVDIDRGKRGKIDPARMEVKELEVPLIPAVVESLKVLRFVEEMEKTVALGKAATEGTTLKKAKEANETRKTTEAKGRADSGVPNTSYA